MNNPIPSLQLERPLAVFDLEATGLNKRVDRIVAIAIAIIPPEGEVEEIEYFINPTIPIPPDAIAVHGITNEDVADCPTFAEMAPIIAQHLENCDLAGYNILGYDIPLLCEEFARAGIPFSLDHRRILDAQRIFFQKEPRDLSAALRYYCDGATHENSHNALADVTATIRVLDGQFKRYDDLPTQMDALHEYCDPRDPSWIDRAGRLKWIDGHATFNFGKFQGKRIKDVIRDDPGFVNWLLRADFPDDTKTLVRAFQDGRGPQPPPPPPAT